MALKISRRSCSSDRDRSGNNRPRSGRFTLSGGASITPEESVSKIDDLTKQILLKEIELEKFNMHYTQEVAKQGRWKGLRYAGLQEINMGTGLAGAIISVVNRGAHIHRAQGFHCYFQESANISMPEAAESTSNSITRTVLLWQFLHCMQTTR